MRKIFITLSLLSYLTGYSNEVDQETIDTNLLSIESEVVENSQLVANEFEGFSLGTLDLPSQKVVNEKELTEPLSKMEKNGLFLLLTDNMRGFFLPEISYRHQFNHDFFEVSYLNKKEVVGLFKGILRNQLESKLGSIYSNMINTSYGFKWKTRYVNPYISLGGGIFLPYVKYLGASHIDFLPSIFTALGFDFRFGFVDLAINYLPFRWSNHFSYSEGNTEYQYKHTEILFANLRLGFGFRF